MTGKNAKGARRVSVQPGGAHLIQERIYFPQESRWLQVDDVRDAVLLISPVDDKGEIEVMGFRSQDAVSGLQTGNGWDLDNLGFNFTYTIPPDSFPDRGRKYTAEFVITVLGNTPEVASHEIRSTYSILSRSGVWE